MSAPSAASQNLRTMVRGVYDIQKLRIQMGNRIVGAFKARLGQAPGSSEEELEQDAKDILEVLRLSYNRITDGVVDKIPRASHFKGDGVIDSYTELCLMAEYLELDTQEKKHFRRLETVLKEFPVFTQFLDNVKGIGPAMAGVIISEIDIYKSKYPSSLWKYAGVDVTPTGTGRSRKEDSLVDREYVAKDGTTKMKKSITFNPFLKTKLLGVLASSFLKTNNPIYRPIYDGYKNRLENHPAHAEKSKGHRHNMAMRYMIKIFLINLHMEWRRIEGLPISVPYHEAKLGLVHEQKVA
jgi:Transposase IS116/IS110/IS902 family